MGWGLSQIDWTQSHARLLGINYIGHRGMGSVWSGGEKERG